MRSKVRDSNETLIVGGGTVMSTLSILGLSSKDDAATFASLAGLRKLTRVLPSLASAYLIGAGILGVTRLNAPVHPALDIAGGFTALALFAISTYLIMRRPPAESASPALRIFAAIGFAALLGGVLAALATMIIANPAAAGTDTIVVMIAATFVTLFATSALPVVQLALLFSLSGTALALGAPIGYGMGILIALLPVTYSLIHAERIDLHGVARDRVEATKAHALVKMFEESDRIWFWETDRRGLLTYVSPKLLNSLGQSRHEVLGTPLANLVAHNAEDGSNSTHGERTLSFYFSARLGFSDLPTRPAHGSTDQWWSLTGRPVIDSVGQFRGFRGNGSDLTERRRSEAEISRLARFDSLTGLSNRAVMLQTLEQSLSNSLNNASSCVLMLIDLDRFKNVNDTLGHPAGDALLKLVAKRLEGVVANAGRVGRLGGDEFTVVLPVAPLRSEISAVGNAIIHQLSQPYMVDGAQISIGASVGVAVGPDDGETADALMRNADLALYASKAGGRGVVRFFESAMHSNAKERRAIEVELRRALAEQSFSLAYQPVVCSISERIVGFEALLRWNHPTLGAVSPASFIPIAEEIGLIQAIGDWALRNACLEAAKWPPHIRLAVNVSPIQFVSPTFPSTIVNALAQAQIEPERLELEITESIFLDEGADTDAMFARLKAIGVRLALDDFGTGYSALGYLRKAPFDKIKIDRSFVAGAAVPGNRNAAIIRSVVLLAESLGMDTTAEGAETMDELEMIRSLGCSHIQGYIFGKPMAPDQVAIELAKESEPVQATGYEFSRSPRISMLRSAVIIHEGRRIPARVRNVSISGVQIETGALIAVGTTITLDLGLSSTLNCNIRWAAGGRMGMAFDGTIDLAALTQQRIPTARAARG